MNLPDHYVAVVDLDTYGIVICGMYLYPYFFRPCFRLVSSRLVSSCRHTASIKGSPENRICPWSGLWHVSDLDCNDCCAGVSFVIQSWRIETNQPPNRNSRISSLLVSVTSCIEICVETLIVETLIVMTKHRTVCPRSGFRDRCEIQRNQCQTDRFVCPCVRESSSFEIHNILEMGPDARVYE